MPDSCHPSSDIRHPSRLRLSRAKGWRLPAGAVSVARPGPWGNPFVTGRDGTQAEVVEMYQALLGGGLCVTCTASEAAQRIARQYVKLHLHELRGKDLACWCRLGTPCHAEVLLRLANAPES